MSDIVISGTGLFTPSESISNEELVESFNAFVELHNAENAEAIANGEVTALEPSSAEFVEKASGIKSRYVMNKSGVLDPERMTPTLPERPNEAQSIQCEIAVAAAREAMARANKSASDIDAVIVAASNMQRPYPAMAVEVQDALGIDGFGFDMNVACSSATFGIQQGAATIANGGARCVLMVNPEICSGHLNFRDRNSHFIFGDVATAVVLERSDRCEAVHAFDVLGLKARTLYSNNIRSNFGYLSYADDSDPYAADKLFHQNGRQVFKEVCPMAAEHLQQQVAQHEIGVGEVRRWWLHQANINMNQLIIKRLLGEVPSQDVAPTVLDEFANTASAGSIIALARHHADLEAGDLGVICSFGAGYSIGSLLVRKR